MNSSSTERRRRRAYDALAAAAGQVRAEGRAATTSAASDSFYTTPHEVPSLVAFDEGVAAALRQHLASQGLTDLVASVDELESLRARLTVRRESADTVSEIVYEMY